MAIFFYQAKVNTMKFLESRKNCMAEYLACKSAFESMDQSQV